MPILGISLVEGTNSLASVTIDNSRLSSDLIASPMFQLRGILTSMAGYSVEKMYATPRQPISYLLYCATDLRCAGDLIDKLVSQGFLIKEGMLKKLYLEALKTKKINQPIVERIRDQVRGTADLTVRKVIGCIPRRHFLKMRTELMKAQHLEGEALAQFMNRYLTKGINWPKIHKHIDTFILTSLRQTL